MLSIVQANKSRRVILSFPILFNNAIIISNPSSGSVFPSSSTNANHPIHHPLFHCCSCHYSTASPIPIGQIRVNFSSSARQVLESFKDWFQIRRFGYMDRIFEILGSKDEVDEAALSQLGLRLNEQLVVEVLRHGFRKKEVLSCLKFFDWAGRQQGYSHRRSAFEAIFKILSRAKLVPLLLDFLDNTRYRHDTTAFPGGCRATLVMGYSVAGKPRLALQMFGEMRFLGQDLDSPTYHALLGSLVEEGCFDAAKEIAKQISLRGFENHVTHRILVKSLCKQKMLDEADSYLRQVIQLGDPKGHGGAVGVLVNALCRKGFFDKAERVIEEFKELGVVPMAPAYNVWLRNLVQTNKLDEALEFLKQKRSSGYVPDIFHYHRLFCRLLKENRLSETCALLINMMEEGIPPDKATMDIALRFFCKGGMVDVALELYKCRSEFSLWPSGLSYNYLINNLCGEGYTDEAYNVFKNSADQGYFPTFSVLVDSLCREGKLDKVEELVLVALKRNMMPSVPIYDKLISALCRAGKCKDGFLIYEELSRMNKTVKWTTYSNLIQGLNKVNKGDVAARLLIEMQKKGHKATRELFRVVIHSLCGMPNPESQILNLLARQLSNDACNCEAYNSFIDGAVHAEKPQLAREIFELMKRRGIRPNLSSFILVLRGYLKTNRISDALKFFDELHQSIWIGRKLYNVMIVGLSEANREDIALIYLTEMRSKKLVPTKQCYEVLVRKLCYKKQFDEVVDLVKNLDRDGRQVTPFLGNTLLLHCLKGGELYDAWICATKYETSSNLAYLGQLIGAFSGRLRVSQKIGNLEEMIKQCFPLDLYTYNMLLRRLSTSQVDDAVELFDRLRLKGFEPNLWSYYILLCGLLQHGRTDEAKRLADDMISKGFFTANNTKLRKLAAAMTR